MRVSRLRKIATKDNDFELQKAIEEFKKEYKVTKKDLQNRNQSNPLYRQWTDFMWKNYPIWTMSSIAYVLRGWSYLVGGYPYGGYYSVNQSTEQSETDGDLGGTDMGGSDSE